MRSSVENIVAYQAIPVPENLLTIRIPSWDATAKPLLDHAKKHYEAMVGEPVEELTDEMIVALNLPDTHSVAELKRYGMDLFERTQRQKKFYEEVLPFILTFYAQNTNSILNNQEKDSYVAEYIEQVQAYADQYSKSLEDYAKEDLKIEGNVEEGLTERATEDFIFKVIANQLFEEAGGKLDEEAYENFIQQNVLHNQADEIEIRQQFPFERFTKMMPEMSLSQEIYDHFSKQIKIKIDPESQITFE